MVLWVSVGVLISIALLTVIITLLKNISEENLDYEEVVYLDQLGEIEKDLMKGNLNLSEKEEIYSELEKRAKSRRTDKSKQSQKFNNPIFDQSVLIALIILLPASALAIYGFLGSPTMADQPYEERALAKEKRVNQSRQININEMTSLDQLAENLARKMIENPEKLEGWILLGRTYTTLNRWSDASDSFKKAYKLSPTHPDLAGSLAEALYMADNSTFSSYTLGVLSKALKDNPVDPKPLFYWGLAKSKRGKHQEAFDTWSKLKLISPKNAIWMPTLNQKIMETAKILGIELESENSLQDKKTTKKLGPQDNAETTIPGPSREDIEAANQMSSEERMEFIRSMVERLAERLEENPNDLNGWRRLLKAYRVLGEKEKAQMVLKRIKKLENKQD